ncbi:MAG: DinB family protein [Helicobacteraceae bacterium]|jgi:uncharacterized damage-inducible protein DinB|nr:DinB family protein [Helicobacteraceae bacterium]
MRTLIFKSFALSNQEANKEVVAILDTKMAITQRQADAGSYYGSIEGLIKHVAHGSAYFLSLYKTALVGNAAVQEATKNLANLAINDKPLDVNGWEDFKKTLIELDAMWVKVVAAASEADLQTPVKVNWFGAARDSAPLGYIFAAHNAHNIHHRGQISQVLDERKIENNYSAINIAHWL